MELKGKRILFLGSSVTYGHCSGGVSFADELARVTRCIAVKEAVSGTTLVDSGADSYVARMKTMDANAPADLFVCQLSTNDATQGKPFGEAMGPGHAYDAQTIAGAMETIIDYARKTWNCPVAFYTSPRYDSESYQAMVDLLLEIQKLWKIEVIDLWNDAEFNDITPEQRELYMADPIHPTYAGYAMWWTPVFLREIEKML